MTLRLMPVMYLMALLLQVVVGVVFVYFGSRLSVLGAYSAMHALGLNSGNGFMLMLDQITPSVGFALSHNITTDAGFYVATVTHTVAPYVPLPESVYMHLASAFGYAPLVMAVLFFGLGVYVSCLGIKLIKTIKDAFFGGADYFMQIKRFYASER